MVCQFGLDVTENMCAVCRHGGMAEGAGGSRAGEGMWGRSREATRHPTAETQRLYGCPNRKAVCRDTARSISVHEPLAKRHAAPSYFSRLTLLPQARCEACWGRTSRTSGPARQHVDFSKSLLDVNASEHQHISALHRRSSARAAGSTENLDLSVTSIDA